MPEYLSPGVYVEEVDLGPRPIEGVSTSTAGMVGMTERGPAEIPVLATSVPQFTRVFGEVLDEVAFPDRWYLPHAVDGFFRNGGQRVYVVRVTSPAATRAQRMLHQQGSPTGFSALLVSRTAPGDAVLVVGSTADPGAGVAMRITDGAATEYADAAGGASPALATRARGLLVSATDAYDFPGQARGATVTDTAGAGALATTLAQDAAAGATRLVVAALPSPPPALPVMLRVGAAADLDREFVTVRTWPTDPAALVVTLGTRLAYPHAAGVAVTRVDVATPGPNRNLSRPVAPGDGLIVVDDATGLAAGSNVLLTAGGENRVHAVAFPRRVALRQAAAFAHAPDVPTTVLALADAAAPVVVNLVADAAAGDTELTVSATAALAVGQWLRIDSGGAEFTQIAAVPAGDRLTLRQPLRRDHPAAANTVVLQDVTRQRSALLELVEPGADEALLADTAAAFAAGDVVLFEDGPRREFLEIGADRPAGVLALGAGVTVAGGHRAGAAVFARPDLLEVHALDTGAWGRQLRVRVSEETPARVETTVTTATPAGNAVPLGSVTGVEPGTLLEILDFSTVLDAYARAGDTQVTLDTVGPLGAGDWVRVGRQDPETLRVAVVAGAVVTLSGPLQRDHGVGEAVDRMDAGGLPRMAKVDARVGARSVRFDGGGLAFPVAAGTVMRSREFTLAVEQVKTGAANPGRPAAERIVATETFRQLTLDDRSTRYAPRIIGSTTGVLRLWDRRPEGQSTLIRLNDARPSAQTQTELRPGPDLVFEQLPGGRRRPVGLWLDQGGDDDVPGVTGAVYVGQDNIDPALRTGLQALRNDEDISLVAVPGLVDVVVQDALIIHCQQMRYRFAVLDSVPGTAVDGAAISEVIAQRQQFDTRYAALYYPWLRISDPYPDVPGIGAALSLPPSGHILGIYARTDVTDGVHKAPANEVVGGILGLQRSITKGEHDVLNPAPVNINVVRDFRESFRGLRSWGARCITSDREWVYVNIRRLFLFLERSLDLGLQSVVFEPNDENLWARVERTVGDFLTTVWRSGALMGLTPEEAFFVKCDETTMTQADIDGGRLIVLIGVAPVKPAEFVIIRIGQWQGGSLVEEA
jgi:phage tail sheath protein FI